MESQSTETIELRATRLSAVLRLGARLLIGGGFDRAILDAELLLGHALGLSREQLVLGAGRELSPSRVRAYERLLTRRCAHEPVAYITGRREFWSLDFHVTPAVLIPRPETERLVEIVLQLAGALRTNQPLRIVDIGTGSGAIAVALASELADAHIFATDISAAALTIAADNAAENRVADNIEFVRSDLFAGLPTDRPFDLLVSNPPYIPRAEIDALEPEVSRWEPRGALDGGWDGLDFYRRIAARAFNYLRSGGAVAVEIGAGMGRAVAALFKESAGCAEIELYQDYAGIDRVIVARKNN
ncbi:MAG: peptide chain release factor N(5)-glutamine methyltransferase [Chloroflexota bacterium]